MSAYLPVVISAALAAAMATGCTSTASGGLGSPPTGSGTTGSGTVSWTDNGTQFTGPVTDAMLQFLNESGRTEAEMTAVILLVSGNMSLKLDFAAAAPDQLAPGALTCVANPSGQASFATLGYEVASDNAFVDACTFTLSHAPSKTDNAASGMFTMTAGLSDGSHTITGNFDLKLLVFKP